MVRSPSSSPSLWLLCWVRLSSVVEPAWLVSSNTCFGVRVRDAVSFLFPHSVQILFSWLKNKIDSHHYSLLGGRCVMRNDRRLLGRTLSRSSRPARRLAIVSCLLKRRGERRKGEWVHCLCCQHSIELSLSLTFFLLIFWHNYFVARQIYFFLEAGWQCVSVVSGPTRQEDNTTQRDNFSLEIWNNLIVHTHTHCASSELIKKQSTGDDGKQHEKSMRSEPQPPPTTRNAES
jgi:hypothetical protein